MNRQPHSGGKADRPQESSFALDDRARLVDDEHWTPADAAAAIIELADNHILKLFAGADVEQRICPAVDRITRH
jgi:hypothetical protein